MVSRLLPLCIFCLASLSCALIDAQNKPQKLAAGQSIQKNLPANDKHAYIITLNDGGYARIKLRHCGADETATLFNSEGAQTASIPCRSNIATPISLIANNPGDYRVEVASRVKKPGGSRYEIKLEEVRPSVDRDLRLIAIERANSEGDALRREETEVSLKKALKKYEEAIGLLNSVDHDSEEAYAYDSIGAVNFLLSDSDNARIALNKSLEIARKTKETQFEAEVLNDISSVALLQGDPKNALASSTLALELSRNSGNEHSEAQALINLGECRYWTGSYREAIDYYQQAIQHWVRQKDSRGLAQTYTYLGYTYSDLGEPDSASRNYEMALKLYEMLNNNRGKGVTLTGIGRLHSRKGENQQALECFQTAMNLIEPTGARTSKAEILTGIAFVRDKMGDRERAVVYYKEALALFQAAKLRYGEAQTHQDLGTAYYSLNDLDEALKCYQKALEIGLHIGNRRTEAYVLRDLGVIYETKGNSPKAFEYYSKALDYFKSENDYWGEAYTLNLAGRIHQKRGDKKKALERYHEALPINRRTDDEGGESLTLFNLAVVYREMGDLAAAREHLENSLKKLESLRTMVELPGLRASFLATVHDRFDYHIDLLMQMHNEDPRAGFDAMALQASERARARGLLDLLAEAKADIRSQAGDELAGQFNKLQGQLRELDEQRRLSLSRGVPADQIDQLSKQIDSLIEELEAVELRIKKRNPRYGELANTSPVNLSEIQGLLDSNTILLEFSLGNPRSYLWAISRNEIKSYRLPALDEIERKAQPVYRYLSESHEEAGQEKIRREERFWRDASFLSSALLTPVAAELAQKRILYVTDGILQAIPLQILPKPAIAAQIIRKGGGKNALKISQSQQLMLDHQTINLPSASALAFLRMQNKPRSSYRRTIAVLADPVFNSSDERYVELRNRNVGRSPSPTRDGGPSQSFDKTPEWPRLRHTELEAYSIKNLVPSDQFRDWQGFDASPDVVRSDALRNFRIVHFATHAVLNSENPELSAIILSMFDKEGNERNGRLLLNDIYNIKMPADLVVLSACKTALGRDMKGEGLIGFTRGFMHAGARRVLASLWEIDEKPTRELMRHFYTSHLKSRLTPAEALREAQIALFNTPEFNAPYKWGGFILQGESQ